MEPQFMPRKGGDPERLGARDSLTQPRRRHVRPIGEIFGRLRRPGLGVLQCFDRRIAWLPDGPQRHGHDAVVMGLFAFAGYEWPPVLGIKDWNRSAGPSAVGASRSFPEHARRRSVFALFGRKIGRPAVRTSLRHAA